MVSKNAMKILVFIEHDIMIRHFVHSHAFDELIQCHEVVFVFPEKGHKRVSIDISTLNLGAPMSHLPVCSERLKVWQGIFLADMLRLRRGNHFAAMRRIHRHTSGCKASFLYSVLALPGIFQVFRAWSYHRIKLVPYHALDDLLDREQPDVIIHPSVLAGIFINDLVAISKLRCIPLVVIMNSWDNPSTKRAVMGHPDWLLVWGPQTRTHAIKFMGMPPKRVISFGAAQFDLYRKPPRINREEFCYGHDIDPSARIILYAGSSKGVDEFGHLCMLDEAIERGELNNSIVVYRPHPWGDGGKGGNRILDHPWRNIRIEQTMRGYLERIKISSPGITTPDYHDTHDLLSSVDVLVSPLSTILIEGALHGKPVMCFLPDEDEKDGHYSLALPMTHFEDFFADPRFIVTRGDAGFVPGVRTLLDRFGDGNVAQELRMACNHFVTTFDQPYAERLVNFIEDIAKKKNQINRLQNE